MGSLPLTLLLQLGPLHFHHSGHLVSLNNVCPVLLSTTVSGFYQMGHGNYQGITVTYVPVHSCSSVYPCMLSWLCVGLSGSISARIVPFEVVNRSGARWHEQSLYATH